jgi:hypothetical protein
VAVEEVEEEVGEVVEEGEGRLDEAAGSSSVMKRRVGL